MPTPPYRLDLAAIAVLGALAASLAAFLVVRPGGDADAVLPLPLPEESWRATFPGRPPAGLAERVIVLLEAPSVADRAGAADRPRTAQDERRWAAEAEASQRLLLGRLRERGVRLRRDLVFTHVVNGFSVAANPRALAELERVEGVLGVFPVRAVYPASLSADELLRPELGEASGRRPDLAVPGRDGTGVTVALLDSGIDLEHAYLHGRVLPGFDLVDGDRLAAAEPKPDDPSVLEEHGTRMAGLVVGRGGPGELAGVAPEATILPLRILGWRRADDGRWALLGRGDLLVAALERAVDPDGDGDSEDAAEVALAPVVEPFAAFADSPEARACTGAARLGTLVVAPAGNDGRAGTGFGTAGAPGGAPAALTVGAVDTRRSLPAVHVVLRAGDETLLDGPARVLGPAAPPAAIELDLAVAAGPSLAAPARPARTLAGGSSRGDFFDRSGRSLVAGRAALVLADGGPIGVKARNAAAAGAAALLVGATAQPAGSLDLDEAAPLPVIAVPGGAARQAARLVLDGETVTVSAAPGVAVPNVAAGTAPAFSSRGLAFGGAPVPEVVAPGVGIATADPGLGLDEGPRYATVTGTSVAAALAAGAAALVAEARPDLGAEELEALLVGSARPTAVAGPTTSRGAGLVDPAAAARAPVAVLPATLALGRAASGHRRSHALVLRNLSDRPLDVALAVSRDDLRAPVTLGASPAALSLAPRASAALTVVVETSDELAGPVSGLLLVRTGTAYEAHVPWVLAPRPATATPLVGDLRLSHESFAPSAAAPAVLVFRAGRVVAGPDGESIDPVSVLDVELLAESGRRIGLVARLRHLLPGRYAVGLTGRRPDGRPLRPGRYVLRLSARPVDGSRPGTAAVSFTIVPSS
jgi:subtilisin family serine protease